MNRLVAFIFLIVSHACQSAAWEAAVQGWALWDREPPTAEAKEPEIRLVLFSATWCGPCRSQKAIFKKAGIAYGEDWKDRPDVLVIDTDEHKDLVRQRGVKTIPVMMVEKRDGERWVEDRRRPRLVGVWSAKALREKLPEIFKEY